MERKLLWMRWIIVVGLAFYSVAGSADTDIIDIVDDIDIPIVAREFAVSVTSPAALEELRLEANDGRSERYLRGLERGLYEGLEVYSFSLHFRREILPIGALGVFGPRGARLLGITAVSRDPQRFDTHRIETGPEQILAGQDASSTASAGICGIIATVHSLVKLRALTAEQAYSGDFISKRVLKALSRYQAERQGMTFPELAQAHAHGGARECKQLPGMGARTANVGALRKFQDDLVSYMNDPRRTWDCTLLVRSPTRADGTWALSHFEHVRSATRGADGSLSIETLNGLDQGSGDHGRIPRNPGTNTWETKPGGSPPARLRASTRAENLPGAEREGWKNDIATVNYVCCRIP